MTIVKCTICGESFAPEKQVEDFDLLECPYCGENGYYSEWSNQKFVPK